MYFNRQKRGNQYSFCIGKTGKNQDFDKEIEAFPQHGNCSQC